MPCQKKTCTTAAEWAGALSWWSWSAHSVTVNAEHHAEMTYCANILTANVNISDNLISCFGTVREMAIVWEILKFHCLFLSASHSHLLLIPICEGVYKCIFTSMNHCLLQNGHLFLSMFPQNTVGTTAISMAFTLFSVVYSLLSWEEHSIQFIVQYDHDVWWKTVFSHVQDCDTYQFNPVSQCNCRGITDRDVDQVAGRSARTIYLKAT